jgi:hypothetical protein
MGMSKSNRQQTQETTAKGNFILLFCKFVIALLNNLNILVDISVFMLQPTATANQHPSFIP